MSIQEDVERFRPCLRPKYIVFSSFLWYKLETWMIVGIPAVTRLAIWESRRIRIRHPHPRFWTAPGSRPMDPRAGEPTPAPRRIQSRRAP